MLVRCDHHLVRHPRPRRHSEPEFVGLGDNTLTPPEIDAQRAPVTRVRDELRRHERKSEYLKMWVGYRASEQRSRCLKYIDRLNGIVLQKSRTLHTDAVENRNEFRPG